MTIQHWPLGIPQKPAAGRVSGSVVDTRAEFGTDAGVPITRPRTSGAPELFQVTLVPMLNQGEFDVFRRWVASDLGQGASRFVWRDPLTNEVRFFKLAGGERRLYQVERIETRPARTRVQMTVMMLPGVPWFADYVPQDSSRVPDFVADYGEGVYGVAGKKVAASALEDIAGEYFTVTTDAAAVTRKVETLTAGDIPETAPAGVSSIIGFAA